MSTGVAGGGLDLADRVAVVTGAASGIGRAIAERLAREGMKLVLADVEAPALDAAVEALRAEGAVASGVVTDVTRFESVQALERAAVEAHGRVHLLCNNAGVGTLEAAPLWELPLEDWRWVLAVNLWGVIHGVKAFLPGMLAHGEPGHVVNTSSGNGGLILLPNTPIYSTSKAAVSALTETLHLQLAAQKAKIRAHVLYPGPHIVESGIFDAGRNRPAEYAGDAPPGPAITLDTLREMARSAGRELPTTKPAEVAEHLMEGLAKDTFHILPPLGESREAQIRERTENVLARRDPTAPAL